MTRVVNERQEVLCSFLDDDNKVYPRKHQADTWVALMLDAW